MAANVLRDIGLDELVQLTGLSRAQFFRAFQQSTGHTPARYMQQMRMRHAATLLTQGRAISDVAGIFGFGSSGHFAAVFRRYNGANPSEWRRVRKAASKSKL
jgi:transcriptional regulator GlxA family with amidase domain